MKKILTREEWRLWKLIKEAMGIVIAIIGIGILISSCYTGGPTVEAWRVPLGIFVMIFGGTFWFVSEEETYRQYRKSHRQ